MASDKPARKRQRAVQKAPQNLILQQPFEFISPLPAQECIDRLKYVSKERAYIAMVAPNKVEFHWQQGDRIFRGRAWAVGCIEETPSNTRITGMTGIALQDILLNLIQLVTISLLIGFWHFWVFVFMAIITFIGLIIILINLGKSESRTRTTLVWDIQGMFEAKRHQPANLPELHVHPFTPTIPKKVIRKENFWFVVDASLKECEHHLRMMMNSNVAFSSGQGSTHFKTRLHGSRSVDVWAVGRLEAVTPTSTRIVGTTGVGRNELLFTLCIPPITILFLNIGYQFDGLFLVVLLGVISIVMYMGQMMSIEWTRESLLEKLRKFERSI